MDSKRAIKLLHNRQYQKHIGNGEYEYIHELTDADVKNVESVIQRQEQSISDLQARLREMDKKNQTQAQVLAARDKVIERQERMIEKICQFIGENIQPTNPCPPNVEEKCDGDAEGACVRCWRRWLEREAQHDNRTA